MAEVLGFACAQWDLPFSNGVAEYCRQRYIRCGPASEVVAGTDCNGMK